MNEIFRVEIYNHNKYDFIIYSLKGENILRHLTDIEMIINQLSDERKTYRILFDTLLYSSNTEDRFIEARYDDIGFDTTSFKAVVVPKKDGIRKSSLCFFKSHRYFIENSTILNSVQKKIISKGIPI